MTDETTDPRAYPMGVRGRVAKWLDKTTTRRQVLPAYALLACGVASAFWLDSRNDAERAADQDAARYSACVEANVRELGDRNGALNAALVTFGFTEEGPLTEADRTRIVLLMPAELQDRYADLAEQTEIDNKFRDCSPEGIDEFYRNPPADPAATTTPEGP